MSDLLQVSDLEKAKLHDTFHSEVITGKVGGLAEGADIDFATNAVTGQVQATMPYILNHIGGIIAFDFATGGIITLRREFVQDAAFDAWQWTGVIPPTGYVVAPGTDPTLDAAWVQNSTKNHAGLFNLNPADGSAHNADDIQTSEAITLEEKLGLLRNFDGRKLITTRASIAALSDTADARILTLDRNELFTVQPSVYGLTSTPDVIEMASGKFAVRSGQYDAKRIGTFSTGNFGHRAGSFLYQKYSQTNAKLLTDLSRFKPELNTAFTPIVRYLDKKTGTIGGGGTSWATAEQRWAEVIAMNPDIIFVRGGLLNSSSRMTSFSVNKDLAIIGVGMPVITGPLQGGSWSKESGYTNVYRRTVNVATTNVRNVFDTACTDKYGTPSVLANVASIALVDSTPNSWYQEPGTFDILVHTIDSRAMQSIDDTLICPLVSGTSIAATFTGNYKLYTENVKFYGSVGTASPGSGALVLKDDGTAYPASVFYNKNCEFSGARSSFANGLTVRGIGLCISEESCCHLNERDGFNYHSGLDPNGGGTGSSQSPHFVEIDCFASGNGLNSATGNNQGSTSHEECHGFRINSTYQNHLDGANIADIEGSRVWMVGVTLRKSSIAGARLSTTGSASPNNAEWWIDGMSVTENSTSPAYGFGDITLDGTKTIVHMEDVISDKPAATGVDIISIDSIF